MAEPTKWALKRAEALVYGPLGVAAHPHQLEAIHPLAFALDEARRQGTARLADPDDDLINRGMSVAAATGAVLTDVQMHDICQALADELEPTDG